MSISVALSILASTLLLCFSPDTSLAQGKRFDEYEVKAAYLYNFAKYVDWPATSLPAEAPTIIYCIIGTGPLNGVARSLEGKIARNRKVVTRELNPNDDLSGCNLLFVNAALKAQMPRILTAATSQSVLTVSDNKGFAASGGIIEFIPVGDKIRFMINHRAARQANLRISSRLLSLATDVIE